MSDEQSAAAATLQRSPIRPWELPRAGIMADRPPYSHSGARTSRQLPAGTSPERSGRLQSELGLTAAVLMAPAAASYLPWGQRLPALPSACCRGRWAHAGRGQCGLSGTAPETMGHSCSAPQTAVVYPLRGGSACTALLADLQYVCLHALHQQLPEESLVQKLQDDWLFNSPSF